MPWTDWIVETTSFANLSSAAARIHARGVADTMHRPLPAMNREMRRRQWVPILRVNDEGAGARRCRSHGSPTARICSPPSTRGSCSGRRRRSEQGRLFVVRREHTHRVLPDLDRPQRTLDGVPPTRRRRGWQERHRRDRSRTSELKRSGWRAWISKSSTIRTPPTCFRRDRVRPRVVRERPALRSFLGRGHRRGVRDGGRQPAPCLDTVGHR